MSVTHKRRRLGPGLCLALAALPFACTKPGDPFGQLFVVIDSDYPVTGTRRFDRYRFELSIRGDSGDWVPLEVKSVNPERPMMLPEDIAIVNRREEDEALPVRVTVAPLAGTEPLSVSTVETAVPFDRRAAVFLPAEWLCRGFVRAGEPPQTTCAAGETCRGGQCVRNFVALENLPDYEVFDRCFPIESCFDVSTEAMPERRDDACVMDGPEDANEFNVALALNDDGGCPISTEGCLLVLTRGAPSGWTVSGNQVRLPDGVCKELEEGNAKALLTSSRCQPRLPGMAVCRDGARHEPFEVP